LAARVFFALSHSCQKKFWQKESLLWFYQGLNTQPSL